MGAIRVAVCDDEIQDLVQVLALIRQYDREQQLQITTLFHASALLEQKDSFDIAFLDIEMEPPNGYDIAKKLAAMEHRPVVIFVTKSSAYTIRGYGVALRYLPKPVSWEDLVDAMDAALQEVRAKRFTFSLEDATYTLRLQDLLFIEAFGHSVVIHSSSDEYRTRGSLKDLNAQLPQGCFAMPHKSYIVNLNAVKSATSTELCLINDAKIPISRRKLHDFQKRFYHFLGR